MTQDTVSVPLPTQLFRRLERTAAITHRSIDEILASTVAAALIAPEDLPEDLAGELAGMHFLSDDSLRAASMPSMSAADLARLEQLNSSAGQRSLMVAEVAEQTQLLEGYRRAILRRAQAMAILAQRGHSLADLPHFPIDPPETDASS